MSRMPTAALVNGEERAAPLLSDIEWQALRDLEKSGVVKVSTTCCHAPATPISVKGGYRYFKSETCPHFRDTMDTLIIETGLIEGIKAAGWSVRCSVASGGKSPWLANVVATSPDSSSRVAFIISPTEPEVSKLGEYVITAARMAGAGIAAVFLFPSIPRGGMWEYVHAGKLITAVKYVPGKPIVAGLDATSFAEIAIKKKPTPRIARIWAFHITTGARPSRPDEIEAGKLDYMCSYSVSYMGEELETAEFGWSPNSEVQQRFEESDEDASKLALVSAEMCALHTIISHFAGPTGRFYNSKDIGSSIVIETSGNPLMNSFVDDCIRGRFKEKYYQVYPRFVFLIKRDILELKRARGYTIALSSRRKDEIKREV